MPDRAPQKGGAQLTLARDVIEVLTFAAQEAIVLDPFDVTADIGVEVFMNGGSDAFGARLAPGEPLR